MGRWDARFPEIEVIALEELNRMIPRAKAAGVGRYPPSTSGCFSSWTWTSAS